jgi:hypothetical protein
MERAAKAIASDRLDRVDGLLAIAADYASGGRKNRTPVEVIVTVPHDGLAAENVSAEAPEVGVLRSGEFVSAETSRRLACDAGIVEMVVGPTGEPLSVGRKRRSIPTALKRAMLCRDKKCRFPGCQNRVFIQGHHMKHWADGGKTELGNVISLCSFHHAFVHEHGYRVELVDGEPIVTNPHGVVVDEAPKRGEATGLPIVESIDERTHECAWDGSRPDYDRCVQELDRAERTMPSWEEQRAIDAAEAWEAWGDLYERLGITSYDAPSA